MGDREGHLHEGPGRAVAAQALQDGGEIGVVGGQRVEVGDARPPVVDVLGPHALAVVELGRRHRMAAPVVRLVAPVGEGFRHEVELVAQAGGMTVDAVPVGLRSREQRGVGRARLVGLGLVAQEHDALARERREVRRVAHARSVRSQRVAVHRARGVEQHQPGCVRLAPAAARHRDGDREEGGECEAHAFRNTLEAPARCVNQEPAPGAARCRRAALPVDSRV